MTSSADGLVARSLALLASFGLGVAATLAARKALAHAAHAAPAAAAAPAHPPPPAAAPAAPPAPVIADGAPHGGPKSHPAPPMRYVHPPHAAWTPGQKQPHPFLSADEMLELDPQVVDVGSMYSLMISAVVPRPIGFISSMAADGSHNLSPYSYFNMMGHNPPVVAIGCCRHGGRPAVNGEPAKKDTLANIEETGEFVVNIISDWFVEAANYTCGDFARGTNEMSLAGLTPVPSLRVRPPRVGESAVQFECKLRHVVEFNGKDGKPSMSVVLGEVVLAHIHKDVTEKSPTGKVVVDPVKLRPISRLGGLTYGRLTELFELARPAGDGTMPPLKTKAEQAEVEARTQPAL